MSLSNALFERLFWLGKNLRNYRAPWRTRLQVRLGRPLVAVADRRTGLAFRVLPGAELMFGEAFHARLYDIPLCPVRPGDLVLDVGANHGFTACRFAHAGAEVIAFEPSPRVFPRLEDNVRRNGFAERIELRQEAVTAEDGEVTLFETDDAGGGMNTVLEAFKENAPAHYRPGVAVPAVGIANVLAGLGARRVRLLKMDCEGSEWGIFHALTPELRGRIDSIAFEFHPEAYAFDDLVEHLLGWEGFHFSQPSTVECGNAVLHLVRAEAILGWCGRGEAGSGGAREAGDREESRGIPSGAAEASSPPVRASSPGAQA